MVERKRATAKGKCYIDNDTILTIEGGGFYDDHPVFVAIDRNNTREGGHFRREDILDAVAEYFDVVIIPKSEIPVVTSYEISERRRNAYDVHTAGGSWSTVYPSVANESDRYRGVAYRQLALANWVDEFNAKPAEPEYDVEAVEALAKVLQETDPDGSIDTGSAAHWYEHAKALVLAGYGKVAE